MTASSFSVFRVGSLLGSGTAKARGPRPGRASPSEIDPIPRRRRLAKAADALRRTNVSGSGSKG